MAWDTTCRADPIHRRTEVPRGLEDPREGRFFIFSEPRYFRDYFVGIEYDHIATTNHGVPVHD